MKRKEFLLSLGGSLAGGAVLGALGASPAAATPHTAAPWPAVEPDNEGFWAFVRAQFPLTRDRAYLNTGGLGASPYAVVETVKGMMDDLEKICETGHSEPLWKEIKTQAAALLGCDADELAFTRNTTEGVNIVANGLPLKAGDEIILTTHEHVGNALTWLALARRTGAILKLFEPSTVSASENLARIEKLLTRRSRLISIPHAVTTTGTILPVRDIAALARARGMWSFVDGAQTAGMLPFDLHEIGCDAYATSGHKWLLGPKETGLLFVRKAMLDVIESRALGAYSDDGYDFVKGTFALHPTAQRYEYGTVSIPLRAGLGAAIGFLRRIGMDAVWHRDRMLSTRLFQGLRSIPGVTVLSPADDAMRSAMVTFMHAQLPHLKLQEHLNGYKLRTRSVTEGGLAALRVSTHLYNTPDEVDRVLEGVRAARG
jgi:selenocysteine lyase/cysteine desulfurase